MDKDQERELETGKVKPLITYNDYERKIWWLMVQLNCSSAKYDQQDAANRALYRALNNQN